MYITCNTCRKILLDYEKTIETRVCIIFYSNSFSIISNHSFVSPILFFHKGIIPNIANI